MWSRWKRVVPRSAVGLAKNCTTSLLKALNFFTWFLMFLLPNVFLGGCILPPDVGMDALWLTTELIIEATALPKGMTWSSWVEVLRIEPGSESASPLPILADLPNELFLDPFLNWARRKQQAWWRHRRGWHRKQDEDLFWPVTADPRLSQSGSLLFCSPEDFTSRNLKYLDWI